MSVPCHRLSNVIATAIPQLSPRGFKASSCFRVSDPRSGFWSVDRLVFSLKILHSPCGIEATSSRSHFSLDSRLLCSPPCMSPLTVPFQLWSCRHLFFPLHSVMTGHSIMIIFDLDIVSTYTVYLHAYVLCLLLPGSIVVPCYFSHTLCILLLCIFCLCPHSQASQVWDSPWRTRNSAWIVCFPCHPHGFVVKTRRFQRDELVSRRALRMTQSSQSCHLKVSEFEKSSEIWRFCFWD